MNKANWLAYIQDEKLNRKEFLSLWLTYINDDNRLNIVAAAMGWKEDSNGTAEHPMSFNSDPYCVSFDALVDGLTRAVTAYIVKEKFASPEMSGLILGLGEIRHVGSMILYESSYGSMALAEDLLQELGHQISDFSGLLELGDLTKPESLLMERFLSDIMDLSMRAFNSARPPSTGNAESGTDTDSEN
jgi:hypothetical protein